jgi:hypothetical protein
MWEFVLGIGSILFVVTCIALFALPGAVGLYLLDLDEATALAFNLLVWLCLAVLAALVLVIGAFAAAGWRRATHRQDRAPH